MKNAYAGVKMSSIHTHFVLLVIVFLLSSLLLENKSIDQIHKVINKNLS